MKNITFSAVMATNLLNVLQGYTKGIRFVAVLTLLLTMGIGQAWADYYILGPDGSWEENTTHQMVSSGITNWVYKNLTPSGPWTSFKVKDGNTWYGKDSNGNNVTVGVEYTPTTTGDNTFCDFTTNFGNMSYYFFFNTSTKKLMVQPNYYLVGTCGASNQNWGQTQNATTYDATKGYFKWNTCTLKANTEYKFKLSGYGAWTYKYEDWNGVTIVNGTKLATDNDKNIRFKSTYDGITVITFNPVTNEMVINCPSQISYNKGANGTGSISSGIKTYGVNFTLSSSTFTRTGYTQDGWSTTDGGNKVYDLGGTYTTDKSITLYPHWKPNTYAVQFNANGGTGTMQNQSFTYDAAKNLTASAFSKTGYTFVGWNTKADGSGTKYDDKASVKNLSSTNGATVTLYAQWRPKVSITGTYHFFPGEKITLNITTPDDEVNFSYQWQKSVSSVWTNIPGATATTYTKAEAKEEDAGHYRCVVSSEGYYDAIAEYDVKCLQLYVYYDNKSDVFDTPLKKVDGATATIDVELQNAGYTYYFKITDGCGNWYGNTGIMNRDNCTDWSMDADAYCGLQTTKFGTYVFNVNYSNLANLKVSVLYPSAYQAADKVIYLDNDVLKWTNSNNAEGKNKIYYRIGRSNHNNKHEMKLVPGTANLYKVTTHEYDNFEVWHIANNGGWSGEGNSIYKTKTDADWAITQATAFETLPVTSDVVTVTPTDLRSVGGVDENNNCKFYNYDITEGMKTWKAQVVEPTNGTITVSYTHHDGTVVDDFSSGNLNLAHTCLLTINATPAEGYSLATLTVNDQQFTSGNPHTLTADATIEATFTINTYTVTWKLNGGQWQGGGTEDRVCNYKYGAEVPKPVDPSRTGYTFTGWSPAEIPETMPAQDLEFIAQWKPTPHTVTWKLDGENYHTSDVDIENPLTAAPENPSDEALGCCADKFMGWSSQQSPSAGDIFTKDNIPANVTTDQIYYAVFATTAQGVGTSVADFSEMGYENGTAVTDPIILGDGEGHGDATITLAKAQSSSNAPTYYTDGKAVRIYAGGTITIASSYHIKNVAFTFAAGDGSNEITANSGTYADGVWTENVESPTNNLIITIGGEAGQHRRIASITVTTGVSGSQYTNYVTQCTTLPNPALSGGSVPAIAVNCGDFSTLSNSQAIVFSTMQDLTCPVTFEVEGDFLISTAKDRAAQYQSKITVTPTKSGENIGKLKNVYVRANATNHNENFTGTLKVTSDEIGELEIPITATVNCTAFTLTTVDHLGDETEFGTYFAGEVIDTEPTPASDDCSENYTFDGWSTSEVKYGSVAYSKVTFPYTMPAKDVTLYPVYQCNKTEDYHRVTSDLGANNWAGDYLIAAGANIFADGRNGGMNEQETMGYANVKVDLSNYISNDIVSGTIGDTYNVALVPAEGGGYLLQTKDKKYNYYSNNNTNGLNANTMASKALPYAMSIDFISENEINMKLSGDAIGSVFRYRIYGDKTYFRFCQNGATSNNPIYLYKKSPLYTTSLICEEVTASDALVTSTAGQTVKVNVMATMDNMTIARQRELTVKSDHNDFAATITKTSETTYNVAVSYTPSAEDNTDGTETATITINVNDIPVTTFQVTGRHLPENFVIAAKWGDNWYALPANCVNSGDPKQGVLIDVNDINDPTLATAPTTTKYGLRSVKPGRQTEYGQSILLTERVSGTQKALYQNNGANENIWVYAQYENYDAQNPTYYEWTPTSNDLTNYTFTHSASSRKLGIKENGVFGAYNTDVQVRLLPATFYEQVAVQVIKWKANSLVVMYTGAETTATTQVGTNAATDAQTLANQKITHGIYELTTNQSLTANAGKILTMCFGTTQVKVEVPLIVSEEVIASANGHDVVILNGGKLTAAPTSYSYNTIYVYGGGKLAIPADATLNVNNIILRAGGIDGVGEDATYQYIYPQVDLKGTLTAGSQTFLKYEYVTDYDHWYHLVLPFNASLSTITYPQEYYGENVNADNKGSWVIKRYDGATRATGNYEAWKDIETDNPKATQVIAGKGYIYWGAPKKVTIGGDTQRQKWGIQRITMNKQAATAKTEENSNKKISDLSSYATVEGNSGAANDQGWNLVGNPYMVNLTGLNSQSLQIGQLIHETDASGNWTGKWHWDDTSEQTGLRYVTIPSDHFDTYTAGKMTETELVAGRSFFVQIAGDATDLVFDVNKKASLMPALLAENSDKPVDIETGIILSNETLQDEVNFWIKDGKTNDYEYNADYPKTPNNNRFNIYGVHTNGDLSWVAINPLLATESMPIGYQVPAAGTYTLSISETYYSDILDALYVTDHAMSPELTVDLMNAPYEFSVNQAETNNERFTISLKLKSENQGPTTGWENIDVGKDQSIKFIHQDRLYILRNGIIYDTTGQQIQTINK